MRKRLTITYSSGVIIDDPSDLASLTIFYDKVWLPYPYGWDPRGLFFMGDDVAKSLRPVQARYLDWIEDYHELYELGVLQSLPSIWEKKTRSGGFVDRFSVPGHVHHADIAMAIHARDKEKPGVEFFVARQADDSTSVLSGLLFHSFLQHMVPKINRLTAEQILLVREQVADVKEGFLAKLSTLADDCENRIRQGDPEMVAGAKTVDRKLIPEYLEFQRRLTARRTGWWSHVVDAAGRFLQIDAVPWSPKFYGETLKVVGEVFGKAAEEDAKDASNASHAFQFLARVEKSLGRSES